MGNPSVSVREDIAYASLYLLIGLFLFVGAGALTWLAYGDAPKQPSDAAKNASADAPPRVRLASAIRISAATMRLTLISSVGRPTAFGAAGSCSRNTAVTILR